MLSDYCKETTNKYNISVGRTRKLVPNSANKKNICSSLSKLAVLFTVSDEAE